MPDTPLAPHAVGPVAPSAPSPGSAGRAPTRLPWPEGALIPATIKRPDDASAMQGRATLSLPGMTLTASLPTNAAIPPSGTIWLQLLDRAMPARFRLLGPAEAARLVGETLERLARTADADRGGKTAARAHKPAAPSGGMPAAASMAANMPANAPAHAPDWPLNLTGLPWQTQTEGQRLLLRNEDGEERGVLLRETNAGGFRLFGRLDLTHLGPVLFCLAGMNEQMENWSLTIHAPDVQGQTSLRRALPDWLRRQGENQQHLHAELIGNWPDDADAFSRERQA